MSKGLGVMSYEVREEVMMMIFCSMAAAAFGAGYMQSVFIYILVVTKNRLVFLNI